MKTLSRIILFSMLFILFFAALTQINTDSPYELRTNRVFADSLTYSQELQLLARCVNGEARGEEYVGQVAVAAVILNRVNHSSFPNTLAGVIYQPGAFTAVSDGQINVPIDSDSSVYKACNDALNGWDPTGGAIFYYNPAKTTSKWIYSREVICTIGNHVFAR